MSCGRVTRVSVQPFRGPLGRQQLNVHIKESNPIVSVRKLSGPLPGVLLLLRESGPNPVIIRSD